MPLVQVQFKSRYGDGYGGQHYTYVADVPLSVGDVVTVPTQRGESEARVSRVDVPESELPKFLKVDQLRHITEAGTPGGLFGGFFD